MNAHPVTTFRWAADPPEHGLPGIRTLEHQGWRRVAPHRWYENTWLMQSPPVSVDPPAGGSYAVDQEPRDLVVKDPEHPDPSHPALAVPSPLERSVNDLVSYLAELAGVPTARAFAAIDEGQVLELSPATTPPRGGALAPLRAFIRRFHRRR